MSPTAMLNARDEGLLRAAIALSAKALASGNQPYGALLADADGRLLEEAINTQVTSADCTCHAELNLVRSVSPRYRREQLARCTLYASGEPCPMCAGAIYWAGIGRVVFALPVTTMTALSGGAHADELALPCRVVLSHGRRKIEVLGPALESEARSVFDGFAPCP